MQEVEEQAVRYRNESIEEGTLAADFPVPYLTWSELADGLGEKPAGGVGESQWMTVISHQWSVWRISLGTLNDLQGGSNRLKNISRSWLTRASRLSSSHVNVGRLEELWMQRAQCPTLSTSQSCFPRSLPDRRAGNSATCISSPTRRSSAGNVRLPGCAPASPRRLPKRSTRTCKRVTTLSTWITASGVSRDSCNVNSRARARIPVSGVRRRRHALCPRAPG